MSKRPWRKSISPAFSGLAALFLAARLSAGPLAYGVLLVAPEGLKGSAKPAAGWTKSAAREAPLEAAPLSDTQALQEAAGKLEAKRVGKIVVVPLLISSHEVGMDHLRYLLGIRKSPAQEYLSALYKSVGEDKVPRLKLSIPAVLSRALDDHPAVIDALAERAAAIKPKSGPSALLVAADGSETDRANSQWLEQIKMAAEAARRKAGYARVEVFIWPDNLDPKQRRETGRKLKQAVAAMRRQGPVAAVAYTLEREGLGPQVCGVLKGSFVKCDAQGLWAEARFKKFIDARTQEAASLPDMRLFKDAGLSAPKPQRKHMTPKGGFHAR